MRPEESEAVSEPIVIQGAVDPHSFLKSMVLHPAGRRYVYPSSAGVSSAVGVFSMAGVAAVSVGVLTALSGIGVEVGPPPPPEQPMSARDRTSATISFFIPAGSRNRYTSLLGLRELSICLQKFVGRKPPFFDENIAKWDF